MRIHTKLSGLEMGHVLERAGASISYERLDERGSRTHARSFEVRLEGTGGRSNTGLYGAGDYSGATWDEWGAFFGALFEADPAARCGGSVKAPTYADAEDFHWQTGGRFHATTLGHLPADTHPRHRWEYEGVSAAGSYTVYACRKCSARRRGLTHPSRRLEVFAS